MNNALTKTSNSKHIAILRIIAGVPLFAFGVMHITGMLPMKPLVEAAGLPLPDIMSIVGPVAQIIAGVLLLAGMHARVGAIIAIGTMLGAVMTHIKIPSDAWPIPIETAPNPNPYVPMMVMAIVIILFSAYVAIKGAGAWSFDARSSCSKSSADSNEL